MAINGANQVWALDSNYISMARGFVYLMAAVDWASREVLAYRVAMLEAINAVHALEEAFKICQPEVVKTDRSASSSSLP
ncbi:DDE-type integrase/transposase/recombinase [Paraburkholderia sp. MM5477-R1]|uniref:DDE-type integrase/transposase/recombinase n=1 Tax=Paraburkholderia sp. MM5477-R1 TaxID=2991062 RepID=UPI003D25F7F8